MAFVAARTTKGFKFCYNLIGKGQGDPEFIRDLPSTVNTAFVQGDMCIMTNGQILPSVALDAATLVGVCEKTQAAVTYGAGNLPVRINPDAVYCVSVSGVNEETVAAAGATAQAQGYFQAGAGVTADDRPNGAYLVVYDGADKGSVYVVRDYDHTGGTVELMFFLDRPHKLDTTSKLYWLGGAAGATPIGPGTEVDILDTYATKLDGDLDPAGGPFRVVELTKEDALDGTIHVMIATPHYLLNK